MKQFAGAILGVAVGASVAWLAIPEQPAQPPASPAQQDASGAADRFADMEARLQALEAPGTLARPAHVAPAATREPARVAIDANVPEEVRVQIAALQQQVADLRRSLDLLLRSSTESGDEGRKHIESAIAQTYGSNGDHALGYLKAQYRIPLLTQYLEKWPEENGSANRLEALCRDLTETRQPDAAVRPLNRFGQAVGLRGWQHDRLLLLYETKDSARIDIAQRLLRGAPAAEVGTRAWAMSTQAQCLARVGRRSEALAMLDALVAEFGGSKEAATYIKRVPHLRERILAGK